MSSGNRMVDRVHPSGSAQMAARRARVRMRRRTVGTRRPQPLTAGEVALGVDTHRDRVVTAVAGVVSVAIAFLLPEIRLDQTTTLRQRLVPLADRRVLKVLLVRLVAFIGIFLPFTYMSAVFEPATGGDQSRLALLLVFGIAATAGNLTTGSLADRYGPRLVVIGATMGVAAVFLLMLPARETFVLVAVMNGLSGVVSFSVIGPQQHRIIGYAPPGSASLVTSLNISTAHLGNFLASALGAVILTTAGSAALLPTAAVFALTAALLTWWYTRAAGGDGASPAADTTDSTVATR
ncbi:putative MFS family arabinose efflux permease [Streptomyces sp. V4I8]|uniref:hypothetical protein n=1 Tax=Streptomyces sp. V4I8 TaxID=3156469 RepID=UPI003512EFB6